MAKCCCTPTRSRQSSTAWFLALLAALTFAVATLGINVVANFVSPAFDFANVFPKHIDFKKGGYIAALIALVLYPFAPWEGGAAHFVNMIGNTMGPIFGVMMVDYYLIRKGRVNVDRSLPRGRRVPLPERLARQRADRRRHRHPVLVDPARASPSCLPGGASMAGSSAWRSRASSTTACAHRAGHGAEAGLTGQFLSWRAVAAAIARFLFWPTRFSLCVAAHDHATSARMKIVTWNINGVRARIGNLPIG